MLKEVLTLVAGICLLSGAILLGSALGVFSGDDPTVQPHSVISDR